MSFSEFLNKRRGAVKPIASVCCSLVVAALCGCSADSERFSDGSWSNGSGYRDRSKDAAIPDEGGAASSADVNQQWKRADSASVTTRTIAMADTVDYGTLFTMAEADGNQGDQASAEQAPGHENNAATSAADPKDAKGKPKRKTRDRRGGGGEAVTRKELRPARGVANGHGGAGSGPNMRYAAPFAGQPNNAPYNPAAYGNEGYGGASYQGAPVYERGPNYRGAPVYQQAPAPYQGAQPYGGGQGYPNGAGYPNGHGYPNAQAAPAPRGAPAQPMTFGYQVDPNYYGPPRKEYYERVDGEKPTGANGRVHVVERGETVYSIARKYGVGMGELTAINRLSTTTLTVGQTLIVPEPVATRGRPAPAPAPTRASQPRRSQGHDAQASGDQGYGRGYNGGQPQGGQGYGGQGHGGQGYGGQGYDQGYAPQQGYGGQGRPGPNSGAQENYAGRPAGNQDAWRQGYRGQDYPDQAYARQAYEPQYGGQGYGRAPGYGGEGAADYGRETYPYDQRASNGRASSTHERGAPARAGDRPISYRDAVASRLRRPAKTAVSGADRNGVEKAQPEKPAAENGGQEGTYVVQRGDTIYQIARRHGVTSKALAQQNGLDPLERLKVGQELRIPGATAAARGRNAEPAPAAPAPGSPAPKRDRKHKVKVADEAPANEAPAGNEAGEGEAPVAAAPASGRKRPSQARDENSPSRQAPGRSGGPGRQADNAARPEGEQAPVNVAERETQAGRETKAQAPAPQDEPAPRTAVLTNERTQQSSASARAQADNSGPAAGGKAAPASQGQQVASTAPSASAKPGAPETTTEAIPSESSAPDVKECEALLEHPMPRSSDKFREPVQGKVISEFGANKDGTHNDGVNFMVPAGTIVKAAENGVVAYAGNELSGFGNLILIRHADGYVTAYAHNEKLLVKRCEVVKRGQPIARSGSTGAAPRPQLHFEIRKDSKPVEPTQLIGRT